MTSERYRASLAEVQTRWSLKDVLDAHRFLDIYDRMERKAIASAREEADRVRSQSGRR